MDQLHGNSCNSHDCDGADLGSMLNYKLQDITNYCFFIILIYFSLTRMNRILLDILEKVSE